MAPLSIYKASAGSGKTFALTLEYLKLLFTRPGNHRHILAVTFTNKAAGEMKERILQLLHALCVFPKEGAEEEMRQLKQATGLAESAIRQGAGDLLDEILNDYSGFSVGTIDKFFQSVIRAFTHEIGIQPGYNLELDSLRVLSQAIDRMFQELGHNPELQDWLIRYAEERMEESRSWNFREELIQLGKQLFVESFQELFLHSELTLFGKDKLREFQQELQAWKQKALDRIRESGTSVLAALEEAGLQAASFKGGSRGPAMLFVHAAQGKDLNFTESRLQAIEDNSKWLKSQAGPEEEEWVGHILRPALEELYRQQQVIQTCSAILASLYTLGILEDIRGYVQKYCQEKNIFLMADSGRFLKGITEANQVPFIYERTGSRYHHIMLDEFQDTSLFQYQNFWPLLDNALASGYENLLVGDVKQSIYRWRNSDWKILASEVEKDFKHQEVGQYTLDQNFRSRENIILFNNTVFQLAARLLTEQIDRELRASPLHRKEAEVETERFRTAWSDVVQQVPEGMNGTGGKVHLEFFPEEQPAFREQVLEVLPGWLEQIRASGIEAGETAILVRTRKEGMLIARRLLEYARSSGQEAQFSLISNESLLLVQNQAVNLLVALLQYLHDRDDPVNNALLKYQLYLLGLVREQALEKLFSSELKPDALLPGEMVTQIEILRLLPLFELSERLIAIFGLGERMADLPYIQAFQDLLIELQRHDSPGIGEFLEYWDQFGSRQSLSVSEDSQAIRILTIHKSKGLEYKAVIVPFCDWDLSTDSRNSTLLWCSTAELPVKGIPVVPVRYSSALQHTLLSPFWYRERMRGYMDKLNLLYVAFTRARDLLFIGTPGSSGKGLRSTGDLLEAIMPLIPDREPATPALDNYRQEQAIIWGFYEKQDQAGEGTDPWILPAYPVNRGRQPLKVRIRNDRYFLREVRKEKGRDPVSRGQRESALFGNTMHQLFSKIETVSDIVPVLEALEREGVLPAGEKEKLGREVHEMLTRPGVADWFEPRRGRKIMNERSLLCGQGQVLRPDRVMVEKDLATVVDYKFGDLESPEHHRQVAAYMEELRGLGYQEVEGWLWYVQLDRTIQVADS